MRCTRMLLLLLSGTLLLAPFPGRSHEGATGILKERMDAMESMAAAIKEIRWRIEANRDLAGIGPQANRISAVAQRMPQLFPPGSNGRPSEALSAIWTQWSEFQAKAARLEQESQRLTQAADGGDPKAIAAQYRAMGQTCIACHEVYRAKR
jgi:cytochrome c556